MVSRLIQKSQSNNNYGVQSSKAGKIPTYSQYKLQNPKYTELLKLISEDDYATENGIEAIKTITKVANNVQLCKSSIKDLIIKNAENEYDMANAQSWKIVGTFADLYQTITKNLPISIRSKLQLDGPAMIADYKTNEATPLTAQLIELKQMAEKIGVYQFEDDLDIFSQYYRLNDKFVDTLYSEVIIPYCETNNLGQVKAEFHDRFDL
jgi:hypothetical protein